MKRRFLLAIVLVPLVALLVILDSNLVVKYIANCQNHDRHSRVYVPWGT